MKRNKFSLSNYKLASMDQGKLVPVGLTEVLPGDSIQHSISALIRVSPLVTPVMHPVHVRIHHWFVPTRILWEDWEQFITGGDDGNNASVWPHIENLNPAVGSLADYLGIPPIGAALPDISALPFRAYNLIWNEFYRDEDLQTRKDISLASGSDATTDVDLQNVCWEKDGFTTARPWTQKGDEVTLPLGTTAPLQITGTGRPSFDTGANLNVPLSADGATNTLVGAGGGFATGSALWNDPALEADLSAATSASINDIREAFALQRYKEARARYGSRLTEYLRYLGVKSSDARLQRPEYLGGGRQTIQFSEVLQTAEGTNPVGEMRGHGLAAMRSNRYRKFFEEHGFIMSLMSVLPVTIYAQGISKMWNRQTKEDYWQKELQHIGQEEILNQEVYAPHTTPGGTFGFQDRYDFYRRQLSSIGGEFRTILSDWHMARIFTGDPALNDSFVSSNPTNRIYASTTTHQLYVMAHHNMQARRLVSAMGNPGGLR